MCKLPAISLRYGFLDDSSVEFYSSHSIRRLCSGSETGRFNCISRQRIKENCAYKTKGAFTRCDKTDATCDKIALCKRAYLCDMRLLHAVAGKLKSSNVLAKNRMSHVPFT